MPRAERAVSLGARCIVRVRRRFFLLVEIVSQRRGGRFRRVVFFRLSQLDAHRLVRSGVRVCRVRRHLALGTSGRPSSSFGRRWRRTTSRGRVAAVAQRFRCLFVAHGRAFLVFNRPGSRRVALVPISRQQARRLVRVGACLCPVVARCITARRARTSG